MDKIDIAKYLMEEGWKAREALEFDKAEILLNEARKEFEALNDYSNVTECLNHLAYLYKLKAYWSGKKAVEYAKRSLETAKEKNAKTILSIRAVVSTLKYTGNFEEAYPYIKSFIDSQENVAAKGDVEADFAFTTMRMGYPDEALKIINDSISHIEEGWEMERMPHKAIWMSKAYLFRGLINYNLGKKDEAKKDYNQALKYAKDADNKTRLAEAEDLKRLLLL